eukprot:s1930_g2.t1
MGPAVATMPEAKKQQQHKGEEAAAAQRLAWQRHLSEQHAEGREGEKAAAERAVLANAYAELQQEEQLRAAREKRREEKKAERAAAMVMLEEQEEELRKRRAALMGLEEKSAAKHANFLQRSGEASQRLRLQLEGEQAAWLPQGPASVGCPMPGPLPSVADPEEQMRTKQPAPAFVGVHGSLPMPKGVPEQRHMEMEPPQRLVYDSHAGVPGRLSMPRQVAEHSPMERQPPPPTYVSAGVPGGAHMARGAPNMEMQQMQPPPSYDNAGVRVPGDLRMPTQGHVHPESTEVPVPRHMPDPGHTGKAAPPPFPEACAPAPMSSQMQAPHGQTWQAPAEVPFLPPQRLTPQWPLPSDALLGQAWSAAHPAGTPSPVEQVLPAAVAPQLHQGLQPAAPTHGNTAEHDETQKTRAALAAASMEAARMAAWPAWSICRALSS